MELDVNRELGALMKAMRLHAGLTQEQMAKALGVTRSHIPNMEHGRITTVLLKHIVSCGDRCGFDVKLTIKKRKSK